MIMDCAMLFQALCTLGIDERSAFFADKVEAVNWTGKEN